MSTTNIIHLNDLHFDNTRFWAYFLSINYPCAFLEESDSSMCDFVEQALAVDPEWVDDFTQYYDGVLEESDGYLEHPTTLLAELSPEDTAHLKSVLEKHFSALGFREPVLAQMMDCLISGITKPEEQ